MICLTVLYIIYFILYGLCLGLVYREYAHYLLENMPKQEVLRQGIIDFERIYKNLITYI